MQLKNVLFLAITIGITMPNVSHTAEDLCVPHNMYLKNPFAETIMSCLNSVLFDLGRRNSVDRKYTVALIKRILETTEHRNRAPNTPVNYSVMVEIISLLESEELIRSYIDFIIRNNNSSDETLGYALGKLYVLRAPMILKIISVYSKNNQDIVILNLGWGVAGYLYPHLNKKNYRRKIVGHYWELLDTSHPMRGLSAKIERVVERALQWQQ